MLDHAIKDFLDSKKQDYLNKKVKTNTPEADKQMFIQEADNKYSLESWLIDASHRAKQLSLTSHPAKFVHPNAKASSIIVNSRHSNDGLLRSGNVVVDLDVFGNAAALDVEKFLRLQLQDGMTVLEHLEQDTDTIKEQFTTPDTQYEAIKNGFLKIKHSELHQTSEQIKQVYFPIDDDYHLLSILNASGIIYKLKERINNIRFSLENKQIREALRKSPPEPIQGKITELFDLTMIGYGGTKPQNISTLNNQNGGVSYLLSSLPPVLKKRPIQAPKYNFFEDCLWPDLFKEDFKAFHEILEARKNNVAIRDSRDDIVLNSMIKVNRIVESIRRIEPGWSDTDSYTDLLTWQKIWLDNAYKDIRNEPAQNNAYLVNAQTFFANWFIGTYKLYIKDSKLLGNDDIEHIKQIIMDEEGLLK